MPKERYIVIYEVKDRWPEPFMSNTTDSPMLTKEEMERAVQRIAKYPQRLKCWVYEVVANAT